MISLLYFSEKEGWRNGDTDTIVHNLSGRIKILANGGEEEKDY